MKFFFFLIIKIIFSLDNSTLSNYLNISLKNLSGIFEPDFINKIVKGNLTYTFNPNFDSS